MDFDIRTNDERCTIQVIVNFTDQERSILTGTWDVSLVPPHLITRIDSLKRPIFNTKYSYPIPELLKIDQTKQPQTIKYTTEQEYKAARYIQKIDLMRLTVWLHDVSSLAYLLWKSGDFSLPYIQKQHPNLVFRDQP